MIVKRGRKTPVPIIVLAGVAVCVALLARWRAEYVAHRRRGGDGDGVLGCGPADGEGPGHAVADRNLHLFAADSALIRHDENYEVPSEGNYEEA